MASIKRISASIAAILIITFSLMSSSLCVAAEELTNEQRTAISQNCATVRESLQQLQHVDSRTRTYLGTAYESISSRFITPLNLRLVRLGRPSNTLFDIQTNFTATQSQFREKYVEYMRSLESLIAVDCSAHPDEFYNHLNTVRQKREDLRLSAKRLTDLANDQYKAVTKLKESL